MVARIAARPAKGERRARQLPTPLDSLHKSVRQQIGELAETRALSIAPCEPEPTEAPLGAAPANELDRLYAALAIVTERDNPRTARLLGASTRKVAQKVIEEAGEVALATVKHNNRAIVRESADLLYHLAVLWRRAGIATDDVWAEMRRRADALGIAEKLPKART